MRIFISWSGERSKILATALHEWLPVVLHDVQPWMSAVDIHAGKRWATEVAKELESTDFGVSCVTSENVGAPWLLFEAGALTKSMEEGRVIPLLLDLEFREITGPWAIFQAKKVEREGLLQIIHSINSVAKPPSAEKIVNKRFDNSWPDLEKQIQAIPESSVAAKHPRPQAEILEELVASVRSLDSRIREIPGESSKLSRHRRFRHHPMLFRELAHMMGEGPRDPIGILLFASLFRDELPWIYELGKDAYQAARGGSPEEAERALQRFRRAAEICSHGPFPMEEMGIDPRILHMFEHEFDHLFLGSEQPTESEQPMKPKQKKPRTQG